MIVILSIKETRAILMAHGWSVSEPHLRAGLEQKVYPFGVAIQSRKGDGSLGKGWMYEIYKPLLMKWIMEREEPEGE